MWKASWFYYKCTKYYNASILPNVTGTRLVIIFTLVFFLFCVCVHVFRCTNIHVCGSQRSMSGTFLNHFPTLFLNLELDSSARLAMEPRELPVSASLVPDFYVFRGKLNLGPHAFLMRTLLSSHPSPLHCVLTSEGSTWEFRSEFCLSSSEGWVQV